MQQVERRKMLTDDFTPYLKWIDTQRGEMLELLRTLALINSGSFNLDGIDRVRAELSKAFSPLGASVQTLDIAPLETVSDDGNAHVQPLGKILHLRKRPEAPIQILLVGHMDTVYGKESSFQTIRELDNGTRWNGPGVADLKGGLVVMLKALQTLERSPFASKIGYEIVFNSDEEIGSTGSAELLIECARRCHVGLIFEPSLPDGACVSERKGSGNLSVMIRGRSAHVGRDYDSGRNAIAALADVIRTADNLNDRSRGIIVNSGYIAGGGPTNVVPDKAMCRMNIRVNDNADYETCLATIQLAIDAVETSRGVEGTLHRHTYRPPKPFDRNTQRLFEEIGSCAKLLGQPFSWKASGGVCDGNIVAEVGLPTIDTLGVIGGKIHTEDEYVELSSLTQRAQLTALYLMKLATGDLQVPKGVK